MKLQLLKRRETIGLIVGWAGMAFFGIAQGVGLTDFPTEQFATILGGIVATISGAHVAQVKRAAQRGGNVGAEVVSLIQGIREEVEDIRDYAAETQGIASAAASNARPRGAHGAGHTAGGAGVPRHTGQPPDPKRRQRAHSPRSGRS